MLGLRINSSFDKRTLRSGASVAVIKPIEAFCGASCSRAAVDILLSVVPS